ncbi:hypothetical protein ACOME3_005553 [Neoechinorhynchus agilis]
MMNEAEIRSLVLQAYQSTLEPLTSSDKRREAYLICEEFKNDFARSIPACVQWIGTDEPNANHFSLHCLDYFVRTKGPEANVDDLARIRDVVLTAILSRNSFGNDKLLRQLACGCVARIGTHLFPKHWPNMLMELLNNELYEAVQVFFEDVFVFEYLNSKKRENEIWVEMQREFLPNLMITLPNACVDTQKRMISVGLKIIKAISRYSFFLKYPDMVDALVRFAKVRDLRMDAVECLLGIVSSGVPKSNKIKMQFDERFMRNFCGYHGQNATNQNAQVVEFAKSENEDDLFFIRRLTELLESIVSVEVGSNVDKYKICGDPFVEYIVMLAIHATDRSTVSNCLESVINAGVDTVRSDLAMTLFRHGCCLLSNDFITSSSMEDYEIQRIYSRLRCLLQRGLDQISLDLLVQALNLSESSDAKDELFLEMLCSSIISHVKCNRTLGAFPLNVDQKDAIKRRVSVFLCEFKSATSKYTYKLLTALTSLSALVFTDDDDKTIPRDLLRVLLELEPLSESEPAQSIASICVNYHEQMREFRGEIYQRLQKITSDFPLVHVEYLSQAAIILSDDGAGLDEATKFILAPAEQIFFNSSFNQNRLDGQERRKNLLGFSLLIAVCRSHATVKRWTDLEKYLRPFMATLSSVIMSSSSAPPEIEKAYRLCGYACAAGILSPDQVRALMTNIKAKPIRLAKSAIKSMSKCLLIKQVPCSVDVFTAVLINLLRVVPEYLDECMAHLKSSAAKPEDEAEMETDIKHFLRTYVDILRKSILETVAVPQKPGKTIKRYALSEIIKKILSVDTCPHNDLFKEVALRFFALLTVQDASSVSRLIPVVQQIVATMQPVDIQNPIEALTYCLISLQNNHDNEESLQHELCKLIASFYKLHMNTNDFEQKMDQLICQTLPKLKEDNFCKIKGGLTSTDHNSRSFKLLMGMLLASL